MKVIRAKSAGFCWGVERAIQIAREQAKGGERTVFTDGPLIHNKQMMSALGKEDIREVGDYHSHDEIRIEEDEEKEEEDEQKQRLKILEDNSEIVVTHFRGGR